MWIAVYIALALAGLAYAMFPLLGKQRAVSVRQSEAAHQRRELLARKDAVYAAIKDLDFEFKAGKLSERDYQALKEDYRLRALNLLKMSRQLRERAEVDDPAACAACGHRNQPGGRFCGSCGAVLDQEGSCPGCGTPTSPNDQYCSVCGATL